jgi:hypothetical protein
MALLALAPACGFSSSPGEGGPIDAGRMCYGTIVPICFPAPAVPTRVLTLVTSQIDTDLTGPGSACDPDNDHQATYCVVAGAGLSLPSGMTLSARGSRPLVLVSTGAMELLGSIDVGSHQGGTPQLRGAGANPIAADACSFAMPPVMATMGGGGAGASLGTQGGAGGDRGTPPAGGGHAGNNLGLLPGMLRGGCPGGDGSVVSTASPAAGGDGGGAIALVAALQIRVGATINASGGGGHGGASGAANGGGGGGSGGMIVFDSSRPLMLDAGVKLWANGGGGGQGSSNSIDGGAGGESGDPVISAMGARSPGAGGLGGDGSVGTMLGGKGVNGIVDGAGGGGGGGGGGFIHAPGLTDPAAISPRSSDPG